MINNIVNITMNNGINVKVDRGNVVGVNQYEIQEHLEDLFKIKKSYKAGERINLSKICDSVFDLIFCGRSKITKEIVFKLC